MTAPIDADTFREWLKEQLNRPGRSQSALARAMGLDSSAINRLVNGKRELRYRELERIRKYLMETALTVEEADDLGADLDLAISSDALAAAGDPEMREAVERRHREAMSLYISMSKLVVEASVTALARISKHKSLEDISVVISSSAAEDQTAFVANTLFVMGEISPLMRMDLYDIAAIGKAAAADVPALNFVYTPIIDRVSALVRRYGKEPDPTSFYDQDRMFATICVAIANQLATGEASAAKEELTSVTAQVAERAKLR